MTDRIKEIVKNNPRQFAKQDEICPYLSCYKRTENASEHINRPQIYKTFDKGGFGGIPLYAKDNLVYVDHTDKHSVTIGQTGSKKSRLIAMPLVHILGLAGESMIISDPKAEIYYRTREYLRKKGYEIQVINLREPLHGDAWNPLALPYKFYKDGDIDRAYEFANDIAVNLTVIDKSKTEAFWDNSAGTLFLGLILLLFRYCREHNEGDEAVSIKNVLELRNALFGNDNPKNNPLWEYAKQDYFIESLLIGSVTTAVDTRAGILSVFDEKMRVFSVQPALLDMLTQNECSYEQISQKSTVVYLLLPDEKTGFHSLVSLYIKQSYEFFIYKAQEKIKKQGGLGIRINYILDEFSSLPAISDFPAMITAARSRNIRFNLFLQSKKQLYLKYAEDCNTIMSNCENWIYLSSRELEFLKELSELCGTEQKNSGQKPLLSVSDLQKLDKQLGQALILHGRNQPMISYLPDIDFYDNGNFDVAEELLKRTVKAEQGERFGREVICKLKKELMPSQHVNDVEKRPEYPDYLRIGRKNKVGLSNEEIDKLIKQIEKLEKELDIKI